MLQCTEIQECQVSNLRHNHRSRFCIIAPIILKLKALSPDHPFYIKIKKAVFVE